ncbi:HAMP domain-containing protein [Oscillochloris sp. ZM17-4]|uniref:sensor histidine kinase n=1 Tax=Oscillochloris sp. ZM17-4 TaxID=2866714 RepID=UPI001C7382C6|nr:ATP-binding protein [Oscillochloris sp. ZM17-4]MBX0327027.1 HAMP domain-containing protein [Oscillochloris sp. ZM17-4]
MIHTLATKLTLAFLLVGVVGALLVALLVGMRTRSEFDRFLSTRDQDAISQILGSYYAGHGSWAGVDEALAADSRLTFYSRRITLLNADRTVVLGGRSHPVGSGMSDDDSLASQPISVNGQVVGYVLAPSADQLARPSDRERAPLPEMAFIQRVAWAAAISAGVAALIALVLGSLLARTLTRPVRELTAATQAMAAGSLGEQVRVRSRDEIGRLATSFNQMSSDLSRASQSRKQMTADLAHDLRTPLSILRGYTEGLKDGRIQGSAALYGVMHSEVEHLRHLVEDLRVLSLADSGEMPLSRRAIDPVALIERAGLAYIVQAEQQGLALHVDAAQDLPSISVDTDRMAQVLNNLVSNALRYTAHGAVTLSASQQGGQVLLQVCDTGSGIDVADLPHIFDRFYRADKARQRGDNGASGLGLAIAKAIIDAHDGTISVESTVGQGTTFTIALPVAV